MDSDLSAPETVFYVSNQSGSLPSSYSSENSDIEFSGEKHIIDVTGVDNNKDTSSSVNDGSENEGFLSGEEEFQTPSESRNLVYPDKKSTGGEGVGVPFENSSEFFTPKAETASSKVSVDDNHDDEYGVGDSEGDILRGTKLEQGGDSNLDLAGEGSVEELGVGAATGEYKEDLVQTESTKYLNFGEVVKEGGFIDSHEEFVEASGGVHAPFGNPSEFFTPKTSAKFSVDKNHDDEYVVEDSEGDILRGTKLEQSGDVSLDLARKGLVEELGIGTATPEYKEDLVQTESTKYLNFGEVVKGGCFIDSHEEFVDASAGVHDPFENSSEFFTPKADRASAKVSVDNDEENGAGNSEGDILRVMKLEQGGDRNLDISGEGSVEKLGIEAATWEYKEDLVQMESIRNLNFGEVVKEGGFIYSHEEFVEASGGGGEDKGFDSGELEGSMRTVFEGEMIAEDKGVEFYNLKDEEDGKKLHNENLHDRQQAILTEAAGSGGEVEAGGNTLTVGTDISNSDHADSLTVESAYDNSAENDDVKFTSAGDLVVDIRPVNLLGSEAAVVGDKEEIKETEIKVMEASARDVSLDNGFNPIEQDAEEPFDNSVTGDVKSDQIVDAVADDDTEHAEKELNGQKFDVAPLEKDENLDFESHNVGMVVKDVQGLINTKSHANEEENGSLEASGESLTSNYVDPNSSRSLATRSDENDEEKHHPDQGKIDGSVSDGEGESMVFGSSEAAQRFLEELEQHSGAGSRSGAESSQDPSQKIDGQIATDSDEEVDTDEEGESKELFDSAALAALLKAATGAGQDGDNITITSQDGSRLFSVERPAGLGPSLQSIKPAPRLNRANIFTPSNLSSDSKSNLSEEEKKKLEKLQQIRIKFLRLIQRLGFTPEESIAAQVLYRMTLVAGRQTSQLFSLDAAKRSASQLEAEGRDDLDFSLSILVLGKTGVGKSATINSIFSERKTTIDAYGPATTTVREIVGMVDGVKIRIFDTPGLKSSAVEQSFNRKILSMVKKYTKKSPPDIVLYVDRLDTQTRDLNDLPLLRSITSALGPSIWRSAIVALTHAASAPPDGPSGSPLSYDVFVAQRSHIVQQIIGQAVGDLRLMNPSLMNPVSLVENHPSCRKNRDGQKVLPNGQSWRPQLLLLCYSMKILSEAGNLSKTQDPHDHRKLFGFRVRSPPLPYLLSWLLQSRTHPKLPADQGGDNGDSDVELADLSDSDLEEDEDEYDQLPPFKPLRKSQIANLSREQQKAYFEEYEYRVKLLQKKQWREELKRMREMKKKGKTNVNDYSYMEEDDQEDGSPATVPVPLPDMALPQSFDGDNPAYRYRFLEPTSQFLTRPVLDTHGWDHDCGYDGVNIEHSVAVINQFPAAVTVQVTKDKKDFSIHLDSSIAAKHGENGSTMAGFDIQNIGKQLAYILRGDTKFKIFKRNKTAAGFSVTFLGENVSTGLKVEDQIALGKRLLIVGSTGTVRSQGDSAYGANIEVQLKEADFPIGQDQSSLGLSLVKWRGDLALGANFQSQFSLGRSYKMAVRAGLNNKLSGQITVRTSSSDQLQIALLAILPIARAIYKSFWPGASENYSIY